MLNFVLTTKVVAAIPIININIAFNMHNLKGIEK